MKLTMESIIEEIALHETYYVTNLQTAVLVLPLPATETPSASFYSESPAYSCPGASSRSAQRLIS
jgi:hypothetical protein